MKTREEIEREYATQREAVINQYYAQIEAARAARDAALAELDDPMARLIAAARDMPINHRNGRWEILHFPGISPVPGCVDCAAVVELRAAIDYAEQRRAQG